MPSVRVPLVCSRAGRRADAELAPARAPATGRLARAPAARSSRVVPALAPRVWQRLALLAAALFVAIALATHAAAAPSVARRAASLERLPRLYDVKLPFDPSFHLALARVAAARGLRLHRRRRARRGVRAGRSPRCACFIVGAGLARDAPHRRPRPPARRVILASRCSCSPRSRAPAAVDRARRTARRRARRCSARGDDPARRREERVPALADVESDHAPAGARSASATSGTRTTTVSAGRARRRPCSR